MTEPKKPTREELLELLRARPPKQSIPDDRYWRWTERVYEVTGE